MSLENAELGGGMSSEAGPRTCKVARFLADPVSWGLTKEDRDWLAGQISPSIMSNHANGLCICHT